MKITHHLTLSVLVLGALCLSGLYPLTTNAYGTSEQTAIRLSDTHVLFTITYRLGFLNRAAETPLLAQSGLTFENTTHQLGYQVETSDGTIVSPTVAAIVLAEDATLNNDRYTLAREEVTNFTLVALAELPFTGEEEYRLKITSLPFTLIDFDTIQPSRMPVSELTAFTTPLVR